MVQPLWESPSFFKVMIGDFETTLRIPPLFKIHLGAKLRDKSVLSGARGRQWDVKIERENSGWFFRDGWKSFISDNSISLGDFLVFVYDGDSRFDVKIYGKSGCEKEEPAVALAPLSNSRKRKVDSGNPSKKLADSLQKDQDKVKILERSTKERRKSDLAERKSGLCYGVPNGCSNVGSGRVLEAACSFKFSHPHFIAICRNSCSTKMTIPASLVKKYGLADKNSMVLRDPVGISWPVKLIGKCNGHQRLSWSDFYKGNCLKDGDVCVFEFIKEGKEIHVHIFRIEEYTAESVKKSGKSIQSGKKALSNREKARKAANSIETKHPNFVALWRKSRLYHMPIPSLLVRELDLRKDQHTMLYDPCGRRWPVKITRRLNGIIELGIGWSNFSRANHLQVGDACLLEFIRGADAIKVHIFREVECTDSSG